LLDELGQAGGLDWSRVSAHSFSLRAVRGGPVWRNPVDRAKRGSKLHLAVEGGGLPLSLVTPASCVCVPLIGATDGVAGQ
jgi:hypothetical protein